MCLLRVVRCMGLGHNPYRDGEHIYLVCRRPSDAREMFDSCQAENKSPYKTLSKPKKFSPEFRNFVKQCLTEEIEERADAISLLRVGDKSFVSISKNFLLFKSIQHPFIISKASGSEILKDLLESSKRGKLVRKPKVYKYLFTLKIKSSLFTNFRALSTPQMKSSGSSSGSSESKARNIVLH